MNYWCAPRCGVSTAQTAPLNNYVSTIVPGSVKIPVRPEFRTSGWFHSFQLAWTWFGIRPNITLPVARFAQRHVAQSRCNGVMVAKATDLRVQSVVYGYIRASVSVGTIRKRMESTKPNNRMIKKAQPNSRKSHAGGQELKRSF